MLDPDAAPHFPVRVQRKLADPRRGAAVARATAAISERPAGALEEAPLWEEWRERARAIKAHVLANLPDHLERFEENATARGANVH